VSGLIKVYRFVRAAGLERAKTVPFAQRKRKYDQLMSIGEVVDEMSVMY